MSLSSTSASGSDGGYDNLTQQKSASGNPFSAALSKLQNSNPALAEKLQKISDRRAWLKKSGISEQDVRKTIDGEFGKLAETERSEIPIASQGRIGQ